MIIDADGTQRHTMTKQELEHLYKAIEAFEADLTYKEHLRYSDDFAGIKTILHQRIRNIETNHIELL